MPSFSDSLDRKLESIKRPPPPPIGSYVMRVTKMPDPPEKFDGKDGTVYERITFPLQILSPLEDTDPDEIAAFGNVTGVLLRRQFLFNTSDEQRFEQSLNQVKTFLKHLGIEADDMSLSEALSMSPNCQCGGTIEHRLDPKDPDNLFAEITKTFTL